ncbi:hypothetical protein BJX63DRAFT_419353 [Aspergillus granulosus]|uniref:Uncharacterized protein n=1 Tax=Aspergillus granulosus TaxID=176169 RepID=A0ABR4HRD1_9EURO
MPGFNTPLNCATRNNVIRNSLCTHGFPIALDPEQLESGYLDELVTLREIIMMRIMNTITDKPGWEKKAFDDKITAKWREELLHSGQDVSERMVNWIISELRWKAGLAAEKGFVEVFDDGVVKSDTAISRELQASLQAAVAPLENVPDEQKDYHPGSENMVVDLVHPSLFPVVYGHTRVLPGRVLGLDDCLDSIGQGELIPVPPDDQIVLESADPWRRMHHGRSPNPPAFSNKFQWLPCEVALTENKECRILSYINNAHPVEHRALYNTIEKILAGTIPLWEKTLTESLERRIEFKGVEYAEGTKSESEVERELDEIDDEDEYEERRAVWYASRQIVQPEPAEEFKVKKPLYEEVDFRKHFPDQNFQVIVKLANIELTPDKPNYKGGTWHIEGQMNEQIVATAIYYYDSENITSSYLAFRHRGMSDMFGIHYEQDQHHFLQQIYGFPDDLDGRNEGQITQELGSVECREGRLLAFPNSLQHRVSPFSLADSSKPGHRKILAMFLVDPHRRIISSANVPPQREDWRREKDAGQGPMSMEEAKAHRLELMEERGMRSKYSNAEFEQGSFCLCEH